MAAGRRWNEEEVKLALDLYRHIPFGLMHRRNPDVIKLANLIGRTPSAVAMKLGNFASLDPKITETGRRGLDQSSALDKRVWADFHTK
jgi:hypothetical protein